MELHETCKVLDSTKIKDYKICPRYFMFRNVLGWRPEASFGDIHLHFGDAFHKGMEVLMREGLSSDTARKAFEAFRERYLSVFPQYQEFAHVKNPDTALKAYAEYVSQYGMTDNFENIYTEVAGSVHISDSRLLYFKLDSINRSAGFPTVPDGMIFSFEHKTGGARPGYYRNAWHDGWLNDFQMGAYTYVMHCLYNPDEVYGVIVNGAFFYNKGDVDLERSVARRTGEQMERWLFEANDWFQIIEAEYERLAECSPSDTVMEAFPGNDKSCTGLYGKACPYLGYCAANANPLKNPEPPPGMIREYWDPREKMKEARKVFEV